MSLWTSPDRASEKVDGHLHQALHFRDVFGQGKDGNHVALINAGASHRARHVAALADGPNQHAFGEIDLVDLFARQGRGGQHFGLDHFGIRIANGIDGPHTAMPDMAQNGTDGCCARVDIGVDPQRAHHRHQRGIVDQGDGIGAAFGFGAHSGQHVGFVIIRHRQHGVGPRHSRLGQKPHIQPITVQDNRPLQRFGGQFRATAIALDHLGAHPRGALFQCAGHGQTDIAAADQHNPLLLSHGLAKDFHCAGDVIDMRKDISLIPGKQLVPRLGREQRAFPPHADHNNAQRGKQVGQLAQRRVQHRTVGIQ
mmetsp:Transcript_7248/g.12127  ORF Transcript_7248/g.12127 Transcript_7248/m.12127 type:complete len:310 (+) Transcript_7248:1181-2110(+)